MRSCLLLLVLVQGSSSSVLHKSTFPKPNKPSHKATSHNVATCAPLANKGSHFTVDIQVGTPGQTFSVVADTGSDAVIVPSCICKESGSCSRSDRCFRGTNKSSTFKMPELNGTGTIGPKTKLPMVKMVFGSGQVEAVIASDVVTVGQLHPTMKRGVLLMVDKALKIHGSFEGILGLGQPPNVTELRLAAKKKAKEAEKMAKQIKLDLNKTKDLLKKYLRNPKGFKTQGQNGAAIGKHTAKSTAKTKLNVTSPEMKKKAKEIADSIRRLMKDMKPKGGSMENAMEVLVRKDPHALQALFSTETEIENYALPFGKSGKELGDAFYHPASFLQKAGINRFSMCFNDQGREGALHLGSAKAQNSLTSIGHVHWSVDFHGISVGNKVAPVKFCSPKDKKP